jgi:ATP-dependent DNA ligase
MNRLAALVDRLTAAADDGMKHRLLADYLSSAAEQDRIVSAGILSGKRQWHRTKLPLVRGIDEPRIDPVLFGLSLDHVGDLGETIALTWRARPGANRDPSPAEIVEALSTLGKSELPKRIESWLVAADASGRWLLIKLITGGFRSPVTAAQVGHALAAVGHEGEDLGRERALPQHQSELFASAPSIDGAMQAVLLYVETGRTRASPIACTFGLWKDDAIVPVGKVVADSATAIWEPIESFVRDHTKARFGPVREVVHTRDVGLVLDIAYEGLRRAPRRKSGVALDSARIKRVCQGIEPGAAQSIDALLNLLR